MSSKSFLLLAVLAAPIVVDGFGGMTMKASTPSPTISRRATLSKAATLLGGGVASLLIPMPAFAEVSEDTPRFTSRMGGSLERYQDAPRGLNVMIPSGWNKFEGEAGAYDLKWQDIVGTNEIKISSNPVKSTTSSISALGEVQAVGASLAGKRKAKLIKAEERLTEDVLFYTFEFELEEGTHQLLSLCVNRGKVWSLDASCTEKKWGKLGEIYYGVAASFMPKIN